ncbi:MAG: hypothetical protein K9K36_10580 [Desulfarculaceae bacterium]|nr:hypothetical protein [Desulfarculaceae bacterium]MCF8049333.1 hypothetical protein [Desulfarculaceae bacterium]MCF8065680.1 hypothetical protein [Desulfarculaceae bacterium]MCF8124151.1 hypothetical protein [Desulfarculaceae bacterium]
MPIYVRVAVLFVLVSTGLFFVEAADARSRCNEMRYRYLQAEKKVKTYLFSYKKLREDYNRHAASLNKLGQKIIKMKKQLAILQRNYPNEPKMWQGKQSSIAWNERGFRNNQKNLRITRQELNKYAAIIRKNRALYKQNYKAWVEYGCRK